MVLTIRHKINTYKKYKVDIWGIVKTYIVTASSIRRKDEIELIKNNIPSTTIEYHKKTLEKFEKLLITAEYTNIILNLDNCLKENHFVKEVLNVLLLQNDFLSNNYNFCLKIFTNYLMRFLEEQNKYVPYKMDYILKYFYFRHLKYLENKNKKKKDFFFRIDIKDPEKKERKIKKKLVSLRLVQLFYLVLTQKHFKKYYLRSVKSSGNFQDNYLHYLECRVASIFYRCSYLENMFQSVKFAEKDLVWVDKKIRIFKNSRIPLMTFFGFRNCVKGYIYWNFWRRINKKSMLFNTPSFIFTSYMLFTSVLIRFPTITDLILQLI